MPVTDEDRQKAIAAAKARSVALLAKTATKGVVGRVDNREHGFALASELELPRRLIASVAAKEKKGKTHFALTAPKPIGFINLDVGLEGVINKFDPRDIHVSSYSKDTATMKDVVNPTESAKKAEAVYDKVVRDYRYSIAHFRTTVVDTGSEFYELLRIARFGKLMQVKSHHYGPVNAEWGALVKEAYNYEGNVIWLHRLKEQWVNELDAMKKEVSRKTGEWEVAGQKDMGFLVQVNCRLDRSADGEFELTVTNSRHNPAVDGMRLEGDMVNFAELAQMVIEESTEADWR